MSDNLCLMCCSNFAPELAAAVAAEGWHDARVAAFPARCGQPPLTWPELRALLPPNCGQVVILGRTCLQHLGAAPADWPAVRLCPQEQCFDLVAGPTLVNEALIQGNYLMTPAWLDTWPDRLRALGYEPDQAREFFAEFASGLLLLDTGVCEQAGQRLAELAATCGLPAQRLAVGLDYTRLLLERLRNEWLLQREVADMQRREQQRDRQFADQLAAMDMLAQLVLQPDEHAISVAIEDLFRMLFAPQALYFARCENGTVAAAETLPAQLRAFIAQADRDWAWTHDGDGFLLRVGRDGAPLAYLQVDHLALPGQREHYIELARAVAAVSGLAIENARAFQRIQAAELALRKSERNLTLAQAIAHLGHWEWEVDSERMHWSDETFRILGLQPQALRPDRQQFLMAIHPDDRSAVLAGIEQAQAGRGFNLEYRVVLPDGRVRTVHGIGEVIRDGERSARLVGTLADITPASGEMLGVIQDITERKALELQLAQEAHTDALTGCANRRHFTLIGQQELARTRRYGGELSVLMLDLDHFKVVNDRHGHAIGDQALQNLARICRETLRGEDLLSRLGGEEFAVLLPQTGAARALEVAERLRQTIATSPLRFDGQQLRITASLGVATLRATDNQLDTLLGRADQALYAAKHAGRNRVMAAADTG